jgi:ABC-type nitrate/sulfonate/bicarbonate transport system permease component
MSKKPQGHINLDRLYPVVTVITLVLIWELVVRVFSVPAYILPAPSRIVRVFISDFPLIMKHAGTTAFESFFGFFFSLVIALIISIIIDNSALIKKAFYPLLIISQTIPLMAIAPIMIIWFGFGILPKILIIILMCFFPIAVSLIDGFAQVDRDYLNLFQVVKASKAQIYWHLKFPKALPRFFSGVKIAVTYMILAAVIGEWLGGNAGIGVYMLRAKNAFALDKVFASIVLIVLVSVLLIGLVNAAGKKLIHWN